MVRLSVAAALYVWCIMSPLLSTAWIVLPQSTIRKQYHPSLSSSSSTSFGTAMDYKNGDVTRRRRDRSWLGAASVDDTDEESASSSLPQLTLYNSKTRSKEVFEPIDETKKNVKMYTCGPTVYDYAHVGNFRAFLTYDLIKRVLLYFGYDVTHVCNLTDVDDKIINRANEQQIPIGKINDELTLKYEQFFMDDLKALNVIPASIYPRATQHIAEMMDMIRTLASKDLAYETDDGSWYFATDKQSTYGTQLIQNLNVDDMEVTERGESEGKRNVQDFCLWKAYKPNVDRDDMSWESEDIKLGRPGWHLECSAMARKYLGDTIDIHGGGIDLKFPHHENEIAQSEGVTGTTFCNCWLHNGFVNINDEKMSKSLGNFLTLRGACPAPIMVRAYRYLVLSSQYRNPLSFTPQVMDAAKKSLQRIDKVRQQIRDAVVDDDNANNGGEKVDSKIVTKVVPGAIQNFESALLDDLSMPRAAASLFNLVKAAEAEFKRVAKEGDSEGLDIAGLRAVGDAMDRMDQVFGIFYQVPATSDSDDGEGSGSGGEDTSIPEEVLELVVQRTEAKESKDWELADSLRARIAELGFQVKDVKGGEPIVSKVE